MQNRSFTQSLHFRDFEILESQKHLGCCGSEGAQALILNKIPGFAKPSIKVLIHAVWTTKNRNSFMSRDNKNAIRHHITKYAKTKSIHILNINGWSNHLHCLISLSNDQNISTLMNLKKANLLFGLLRT